MLAAGRMTNIATAAIRSLSHENSPGASWDSLGKAPSFESPRNLPRILAKQEVANSAPGTS